MQYNIIRDSNLRCNVLFINKKEPLSAALSCLTRIDILHIQSFCFFPTTTTTTNKLSTTVIMITSLWSCVIFCWSYQCVHHNTHERPTNICKKPILSLHYRRCDNNWNQWRLKVAHVAPMNWQHICSLQWDIHLRVSYLNWSIFHLHIISTDRGLRKELEEGMSEKPQSFSVGCQEWPGLAKRGRETPLEWLRKRDGGQEYENDLRRRE